MMKESEPILVREPRHVQPSLVSRKAGRLRRHSLILIVLIFAGLLYSVWSRSDVIGLPFGDGPAYLMMAQHYSPYNEHDPVYAQAATYSRFPPLYPMLLAALDAAGDLRRAHAVTVACLLLALLAYHAWLRREGFGAGPSALLVLVFAALPGSWLLGLSIQSEYLYLFFSLLALTFMGSYQLEARREILYAAALAVAAAALTRTVGITLLAPLVVVLWRAPRRIGLLCLIIALAPLLAWHLAHRPLVSYVDALGPVYGRGWHGLYLQLAKELPALHKGFADNFLRTPAAWPLAELLGLLGLVGATWRAFRLKVDGIYAGAHLTTLLIWPYPEEAQRFLWVLVPLLLAQPLLVIAKWPQQSAHRVWPKLLTTASAGMALLMSLPTLAMATDRYRSAAYSDLQDARAYVTWYDVDPATSQQTTSAQAIIVNAMRSIAEHVPDSDCVISTRPDLINYYGHRRSVATPLNSVPDPAFGAILRRSGCRFIFVASTKDSTFPAVFHPLQRLGPHIDVVYESTLRDEDDHSNVLFAALVINPTIDQTGDE